MALFPGNGSLIGVVYGEHPASSFIPPFLSFFNANLETEQTALL
jgi:hypothetical protein